MPYRILSIDGGGLRGLIPIILLQRLEQEREGFLDSIDLFCGTSTGSLIALALAHGLSLADIRSLYEDRGQIVFDDSWADDVVDLGRTIGAEYDNRGLRRELKKIFGDATLADVDRSVLIPTFDLDNDHPDPADRSWKPKLFHNLPGDDRDSDVPLSKLGLYATAAPSYFPSVDGFIDGAVYGTNPSMCALAQALDAQACCTTRRLRDLRLLSLGTGRTLSFIKGQRHNWGLLQWAGPVFRIISDGVSGIADYQCRQLLGTRYHRLAPTFPAGVSVKLDDVRQTQFMIEFAEGVDLKPSVRWLKKN